MARLAHHLDDLVEAHAMTPIAEGPIGVGIQGTSSSEGITLNAGDLDESADRVTGEA